MNAFTRLLVVVEPSETAARVLGRGILIARYARARIDLLLATRADGAAAGERFLTGLLASVAAEEVPIRPYVRTGNSLVEIVAERQRKQPADLIIKYPGGRDGGGAWSTSDWQLQQGCQAPLLLTQGKPWQPQPRLASATEPSPGADSPEQDLLGRLAGSLQARSEVLHLGAPGAPGLAALVASAHGKRIDLLVLGLASNRPEWREYLATLSRELPEKLECDLLLVDRLPGSADSQPVAATSPESSTMRTS